MSNLVEIIKKLRALDVSSKTDKKQKLTYLSWTWAWDEVLKNYPEATYKVIKQDNGLPYIYDENTGYMVFTQLTIEGLTHEMWLPVMDGANKSMKKVAYKYKTKYGDKDVAAATTFDINKTIMRCLVKNLAMFGLGIYIFAGDDIPTSETQEEVKVSANLAKLQKGDGNWDKVSAFVKANKAKGNDVKKLRFS